MKNEEYLIAETGLKAAVPYKENLVKWSKKLMIDRIIRQAQAIIDNPKKHIKFTQGIIKEEDWKSYWAEIKE